MGDGVVVQALKAIAEGLAHRLDLSNCELSEGQLSKLCDALIDNEDVHYLRLSGNNIGPEGARCLAAMLKRNAAIETLDLNVNQVGDDGALALSQALRENHTLAELFLYGNGISVVGDNHLLYGVQHNDSLTFIDLEFDPVLSNSAVQQSIQAKVKANLQRCLPGSGDALDFLQAWGDAVAADLSLASPAVGEDGTGDATPPAPEATMALRSTSPPSERSESPPKRMASAKLLSPRPGAPAPGSPAHGARVPQGCEEVESPLGSDWPRPSQLWVGEQQSPRAHLSNAEYDTLLETRHGWRAGACGGKTQAFATYSESQKALALQAYTDAGLSGKVFDSMGGGEKMRFFTTLSDTEKIRVLNGVGEQQLPRWTLGQGGGKTRAFSYLSEQEKCDALNALGLRGVPKFTARSGTGKVGFFASLPDELKVKILQDATRRTELTHSIQADSAVQFCAAASLPHQGAEGCGRGKRARDTSP
eukprot:EG_transcript_5775